jgi:minor pilin subunit PapF
MRSRAGSVKAVVQMLLGGIFFFGLPSAYAVDVNIKITGEIYIHPCKVNNNTDFTVSFPPMSLYEVDGATNAVTTPLSLSCDYYQGTPYIRITGTTLSGAGDNVLQTNIEGLGIALYQGNGVNTAYPLRTGAGEQGKYGYEITRGLDGQGTQNGTFTFTAVPYKQGSGTLVAGNFSATATMSITYL